MAQVYPSRNCTSELSQVGNNISLSLFHNRSGAAIILLWNFSAFCVFHYITKVEISCIHGSPYAMGLASLALICVPLAGILADSYVGRYKFVKFSMRCIWLGLIGQTVVKIPSFPNVCIEPVFLLFIDIGMTGFFTNTVQLSMDQLHDASSGDIQTFLYLYYWTYCATKLIVVTVCIPIANISIYKQLIPPVLMTVALCFEFLLSHKVIQEPASDNPLKLICKVLQYAIQNKHPRKRSAFTYCDDKLYSRIDLGKSKYGGPFTTEQVENVKTFFRMTVMIVIPALLYGCFIYGDLMLSSDRALHKNNASTELCYKRLAFSNIGEMILTLLIPLCMISKIISKYVCYISILRRCGVGLTLIIVCLLAQLITQVLHQIGFDRAILGPSEPLVEMEDKPWPMVGYSIVTCFSEMLVTVACLEFVCAQSPYSMKGLLLGTFYFSVGVSYGAIKIIRIPFPKNDIWFVVTGSVAAVFVYIVFIVASIWYKRRQREDHLPSENYFAEKYYEKLLEHGSCEQ